MTSFEVCIIEKKFPELIKMGEEAKKRGAFVGSTEFSTYQDIRKELGPENIYQHAYLIYGASLERCVSGLAEQLIYDHNASQVTIDLLRSFSFTENTENKISPAERLEKLLSYRPSIVEFLENKSLSLITE